MTNIETSRGIITLRKFQENDLNKDYIQALNDESHMKFSRQRGIHHNQETSLAYLKELEDKHGILLGIFCQVKERNIGTISATFDSGYVKLGFLVFPQYSGKGLLSELLPKWIQFIEGRSSLKKFYIGTERDNLAMRVVAERAGFVEVQPDTIKGRFAFDSSISIVHYLRENSP